MATVYDSESGISATYYYDLTDRMVRFAEKGDNYSHSIGYEYDTINNLTQVVETVNGVAHTTSYAYDLDNRITGITTDGVTKAYTYDAYGRITQQVTSSGGATILTETYTYTPAPNGQLSAQVATYRTQSALYDVTYAYTYDDNGNILSISDGTNTASYVYDSANQLIRENDQAANKTTTWSYDNAGNILSESTYAYTTGELGSASSVKEYTYGEDAWGDLLTEYDGETITYDAIGNPTRDHADNTYTWKQGRQLASYKEDGNEAEDVFHFVYNTDGLRVKAYNAYTTYRYIYSGTKLLQMEIADTSTGAVSHTLSFTYDAEGTPQTLTYDGTVYYYAANLQGDVLAILDSTGAAVVTYSYDAWGRHTSGNNGTGTLASTLGKHNPLRYRGYVFDTESGLYYLQSRYYNPEIGRFLNADIYVSTGQGLLGSNMFAYCRNNPVKRKDASGTDDVCVAHADDMDNFLVDLGYTPGGYAYAYNSIDAGYYYGVDFTMASNSSLMTGGIYRNGYTAYGGYSSPTGSGYSSASTTSGPSTTDACFVAGTSVQNENGSKAIEDISVGDKVWAWDEETGDVALKEVVETYVNETTELVHVFVNGEEIITTPSHPFYSPVKGWTDAVHLRAGDILVLVNGEYVVVEKIQHEILESPITVYNFQVEDFHTYYVGKCAVLVHNGCGIESASRGVGGKGWVGDQTWRENISTVGNGGTITTLNGGVPTETQAIQLIEQSGGTVLRIEGPHQFPNPHNFPHINYVTRTRLKGTIRISEEEQR